MGIRRRRKKLTTIITSVDRRLRSVEYRNVPTKIAAKSITTEQITDGTIPPSDPKDSGATGAIASDTSPAEFAVITAATYSARNITGTNDRVDVTTATNHGLSVGDKVTIYGLNNNDVNLDGNYTITEVPTSTTLRFSRGLTGFYPSAITMTVRGTVSSRYSTTTTATLTLNTTSHGFVVGDVITVSDVPDDTFFNGTFKVSAVDGANVSYNFASTQTAVSVTSSVGYVKAVLHKYVIIGDTWIDTSVTPNVVKVWDGLTWTNPASLPEGAIIDDHMAPKAPTNLSAITSGYYNPTSGQPAVAVTLSWDAPTQNADDSSLTDLAGYKVFYRYLSASVDGTENGTTGYEPPGQTTTPGSPASSDATVTGTFSWNNTFASTVPAIGLSTTAGTLNVTVISAVKGKKSVVWTVTGLADDDAFTVAWTSSSANKYGAGSVSGTIGSTTYTTGSTPAQTGFSISGAIKVTSQTKSTVSATPDVTTDIPSTSEVAPAAQWVNAGDTDQTTMSLRDFAVASTIEFAVQAYDSSKLNYSVYSDALTVETGSPAVILSPPSAPTAEARLGTITVKWNGFDDEGSVPPPFLAYTEVHLSTSSTFTPDSTTLKGRMERLGYNELVIANLVYGTTYYAKLVFVSTTGAATQASDPSTGVTVVALVNTDIIGQVISGAKITPGTIDAAESIVGLSITGDLIRGNTIEAGSIKTNSLTADQIRAGALDAFQITGSDIRTAASGARVTINSGGLTAYAANGTTETFKINGLTGAVTITGYVPSGGAASDVNAGSTTINGGQITTRTLSASSLVATDIIRLGDSNTSNPNNYIQFGHISIYNPATGSTVTTPGILGRYNGGSSGFYIGGWDDTFSSGFAGVGMGIRTDSGSTFTFLHAESYYNGTNYEPGIILKGGAVAVTASGGSFSDPAQGDISLTTGYYGRVTVDKFLRIGEFGGFTDASNASDRHPFQIGETSGINLRIDNNEIFSVNSGSSSPIYIGHNGGKVHVGGNVSELGGAAFTGVWGNVIGTTGTRDVYIADTGQLGVASSSRRYKNTITDLDIDPEVLLNVRPVTFKYNPTDMSSDMDSDVVQLGFIAEELDELGLNMLVGYDLEGRPDDIQYSRYVVAMQLVVRHLSSQLAEVSDRLRILEGN